MKQAYAEVQELIGRLSHTLKVRGLVFGTAESCTGGLAAALCTGAPGSSAWFAGGVVAYANRVKINLLGVSGRTLDAHGAVSEAVVREMALGGRERLGVGCCLAVSGVAGPDGGTPEKPVGTVWLAVALRAGEEERVRAERRLFSGGRSDVRLDSVREGLALALRVLEAG